ncbi:MAG: P-loop NTPase [Dysosmobacter welbionis]
MSECTHDCSTCGESCSERQEPQSLLKEHHPEAHIGKVFGIVSGKGGVGKSMVTSQLAVTMRRRAIRSAFWMPTSPVPSIPKAFGIHGQATGSEAGLYPMVSKTGIQVMSTNLLLPNETDPVIWRGPVISGVVQQFWTDVLWNCDYLFVDMPPGTGDVSLSVFQSIPLDGIVIVASPQELVSMVVEKAVKMAEMMEVPIVGLVENMSYVTCPDCGSRSISSARAKLPKLRSATMPVLAEMPIDPALAALPTPETSSPSRAAGWRLPPTSWREIMPTPRRVLPRRGVCRVLSVLCKSTGGSTFFCGQKQLQNPAGFEIIEKIKFGIKPCKIQTDRGGITHAGTERPHREEGKVLPGNIIKVDGFLNHRIDTS